MGVAKAKSQQLTISREQLIDVVTTWEEAAARDPSAHTFTSAEAKAAHLWELLAQKPS